MNDLRQQLCGFLIHEETSVESILGHHSLENVFQEIDFILKTTEPETIAHVLGFVRDVSHYQHPFRDGFHEKLALSEIWKTLERLLYTPNFNVRKNAIYTIGKLTNKKQAYLLSDAFPFYLKNDPINLPQLLLELLWLTNEWNWSFIEQVATAEHYLQRWSLCQIFDDHGSTTEISHRFISILVQLKNDSHSLVAAEANLCFEKIKVKLGPKPSKAEWREQTKRILNLQPRWTFESVAMQFMHNKPNYSLDDFDRFVMGLQ